VPISMLMADGRWPMADGRWPMADGREVAPQIALVRAVTVRVGAFVALAHLGLQDLITQTLEVSVESLLRPVLRAVAEQIELPPELATRGIHPRLHRTQRELVKLRELPQFEPMEVVEFEQILLRHGHTLHRIEESLTVFLLNTQRGEPAPADYEHGLAELLDFSACTVARAKGLTDQILGDPDQVGADGAAALKAIEALGHPPKHLLDQILDLRVRQAHQKKHPQHVEVPGEQLASCISISATPRLQQLEIGPHQRVCNTPVSPGPSTRFSPAGDLAVDRLVLP